MLSVSSGLVYLIGSIISLFGSLLLLRAWLWVFGLSPRHPFVQLTRKLTQWIVGPVSMVLPPSQRLDSASLVVGFGVAMLYVVFRHVVVGFPNLDLLGLTVVPLALLVSWGLQLLNWTTLLWVILSWVNPQSPAMMTLELMLSPILNPLRRVLPNLGGLDISPIVIFLVSNALLLVVSPVAQGFVGSVMQAN